MLLFYHCCKSAHSTDRETRWGREEERKETMEETKRRKIEGKKKERRNERKTKPLFPISGVAAERWAEGARGDKVLCGAGRAGCVL